jgi:hypothetical protein
VAILFLLIVYFSVRISVKGKILGAMMLLGEISSPYALHSPPIKISHVAFGAYLDPYAPYTGIALAFVAIAIALMFHSWVDVPLRKHLRAAIMHRLPQPSPPEKNRQTGLTAGVKPESAALPGRSSASHPFFAARLETSPPAAPPGALPTSKPAKSAVMRAAAWPSPKGLWALGHRGHRRRIVEQGAGLGHDARGIGAHQFGGAGSDALGPLGGFAHHQHGLAQRRGFFRTPPLSVSMISLIARGGRNGDSPAARSGRHWPGRQARHPSRRARWDWGARERSGQRRAGPPGCGSPGQSLKPAAEVFAAVAGHADQALAGKAAFQGGEATRQAPVRP